MGDEHQTTIYQDKAQWQRWLTFFVGYFGFMLLMGWIRRGFEFNYWLELTRITFILGGIIGVVIPIIDRLVYVYWSYPEDPISKEVQSLIKRKEYSKVLETFYLQKEKIVSLAMNNVLFMSAWSVIALFLLTSSYSALARGMVLGIGLDLMIDIVSNWNFPGKLKKRLFWPIKRSISNEELRAVLWVFIGAFIMASFLGM